MKVGAFLDALRAMPTVKPQDFLDDRPFVVLSPHPDDETLGLGGLLAAACAMGQAPHVVVLTDGAGSHPQSQQYPPDRLVALRKGETAAALARLGLPPGNVTHLDWPDTWAPTSGPHFEAARARIGRLLEDIGGKRLFVTWRRDPHCDHEAAAVLAEALRHAKSDLELWFYPIWGWHLDPEGTVDEPPPQGVRLDIAPWETVKRAAIDAHASQMTDLICDDPYGFRFTPKTLAPFLGPTETVFSVPT